MKFRLVEDINKYYRFVLHKDNQSYSFFIELGKYLKQLYDENNEIYDDFNYALSELEYVLPFPNELDFESNNYNFAFTKKALEDYKDEIDNVCWYIQNYSPYEVEIKEVDIDDKDIVYKDNLQVAWRM